MSCNPELCAACGEHSFGVVRELCPRCNEPFPPGAVICNKVPAECLVCLNFDHQRGECAP